jgi:predicted transcriptional regulator
MTLTIRQQLLIILGRSPKSMTCAQLVAELNKIFSTHLSSATVASALKKMHDEQLVARIDNAGKRGGYAYKLSFGGIGWYIGLVAKQAFTNFSEAVRSIVEQ